MKPCRGHISWLINYLKLLQVLFAEQDVRYSLLVELGNLADACIGLVHFTFGEEPADRFLHDSVAKPHKKEPLREKACIDKSPPTPGTIASSKIK